MKVRARSCGALLLASLIGTAATSHAQQPATPAPAAAGSTAAPTAEAKEEARVRYERGMQLYNDGAFDLALIELQRAFDLAPSYKLLFNIGQINAQLANYAGALKAFERYLAEGGSEVAASRRAEVEKEIQTLRARTANVNVRVNVDGAEVLVDGFPQPPGTPGQPLLVNAGVRKIGVRKNGYQSTERVLTLAGGDTVEVALELTEVQQTTVLQSNVTPAPKESDGPSYLWVGWLTTGVFTAGAVITGIAALNASGDLDDEVGTPTTEGQTPDDKARAIEDAESSRMALAVTTDVLAGCAIIAGGITIAFTIMDANDDETAAAPPSPKVRVGVRPTGLDLLGTF